MEHKNFQEAIKQLSNDKDVNSKAIQNKFGLSQKDMKAMKSDNSLVNSATRPTPFLCCCCG